MTAKAQYDAIVVGAGFAGATAARELGQRGLSVLVLEGRDRIGGRTWLDTWQNQPVEMGGMNIHWAEPFVWNEITRYRAPVAEASMMGLSIELREPTSRTRTTGAQARAHIGEGLAAFYRGHEHLLPRPFDVAHDLDEDADEVTITERLSEIDTDPRTRAWLGAWLNINADGCMDDVGMLHPRKFIGVAGGEFTRTLELFGRFSLAEGTAPLLRAILADSGAQVQLRQQVDSVEQDAKTVWVSTNTGAVYEASVAVIATSANLWQSIRFTPNLSLDRRAAGESSLQSPRTVKIWLAVHGEVPDLYVLNHATDRANPIASVRKHTVRADGTTLLLAWGHDGEVDETDHESLADAVLDTFGVDSLHVSDVKAKNWAADALSGGGVTLHRPGHAKFVTAMGRPELRVAFATADMGQGFPGIDGAIESGILAGRQALSLFTTGAPLTSGAPRSHT